MKSDNQISYLSQMGLLFGGLALSFLLLNLVSAALIGLIRWGLTELYGGSPFTLNGTEILLGAVLVALLFKRFAEEMHVGAAAR